MEEYVAVLEQQGLKPSSGNESLSVLRQKVRGTQSNPTPFPILLIVKVWNTLDVREDYDRPKSRIPV